MIYKLTFLRISLILSLHHNVIPHKTLANKLNLTSRKSAEYLISKRNLAVFIEGGLIENQTQLSDWHDWEKDSSDKTVAEIDSKSSCRQEDRDKG